MSTHQYNSGFTLLEIIIYISLAAMLLTSAWISVFQLMDSARKNEVQLAAEIDRSFLHNKFAWAIEGATSIAVNNSSLTIYRADIPAEANPFVFDIKNNNTLYLQRGGNVAIRVTPIGAVTLASPSQPFEFDAGTGRVTVVFNLDNQTITWKYYLR
jgi:type II secretory pathway pseudopilin PulG